MPTRLKLVARCVGLMLAFAAVGCVHPEAPRRMAELRVIAEPAGTTVYENDRFMGSARILAKEPKTLKPGVKFLTFKASGFFPHDLRIELAAGETTVKIKLRPIPP